MRPLIVLVLAAVWVAIGTIGTAAAEPVRVALVIGNGDYRGARLHATVDDAMIVARSLRNLGFDVVDHQDLNLEGMKQAIQEFGGRLRAAGAESVGLFYYAGHGVQVRGQNYLVPLGAKSGSADDESVSVASVLSQIEGVVNSLNFLILDASYDYRYGRNLGSRKPGLAKMRAPEGMLIAFSAAPDKKAIKTAGDNSNYSSALVKNMETKGTSLSQLFQLVRMNVMGGSKTRQIPWESSSLTEEFKFAPSE